MVADPDGGHAHFCGRDEISRDVLEQGCGSCAQPKAFKKTAIGGGFGLGQEIRLDDIEHVREELPDTQPLENPSGVAPGVVGVDDLAPPKFFQAPGQLRIGGEQGEVNIMNIIEEGVVFGGW